MKKPALPHSSAHMRLLRRLAPAAAQRAAIAHPGAVGGEGRRHHDLPVRHSASAAERHGLAFPGAGPGAGGQPDALHRTDRRRCSDHDAACVALRHGHVASAADPARPVPNSCGWTTRRRKPACLQWHADARHDASVAGGADAGDGTAAEGRARSGTWRGQAAEGADDRRRQAGAGNGNRRAADPLSGRHAPQPVRTGVPCARPCAISTRVRSN